MVKAHDSRFKPSPNLDKVTVSFDKLINTDLITIPSPFNVPKWSCFYPFSSCVSVLQSVFKSGCFELYSKNKERCYNCKSG